MRWWGWALLAWVVLSVPAALVIGRVIRRRDERRDPTSGINQALGHELPKPRQESARAGSRRVAGSPMTAHVSNDTQTQTQAVPGEASASGDPGEAVT